MSGAFDDADYYSCDDDAEGLGCETPEEALEEWLDEHAELGESEVATIARMAPITVTAYVRERVDDGWIERVAKSCVEDAAERWCEEYGDPDGGGEFSDAALALAATALAVDLRVLYATESVWRCEVTGKRSYSAEEIVARLRTAYRERGETR